MLDEPSSASSSRPTAPNPFSTGGGGTFFENKVQSGLLTLLLVGAYAPIFESSRITELHLQIASRGFATDDALLITSNSASQTKKQLWSVKREVKFTESDEVFREVIGDAWKDYSNRSLFTATKDVVVLATSNLSTSGKHFLTVLEICRASSSWDNFQEKVKAENFMSKKGLKVLQIVRDFLNASSQSSIADTDFWTFLRSFYVLSFDFDNSASVNEAHCKTVLNLSLGQTSSRTGSDLWNEICAWVASRNPRAGSFERKSLPAEWAKLTSPISAHLENGVIQRLLEHSKDLSQRIRTTSGPKSAKLHRNELISSLAARFLQDRFTLVVGSAGSGKSASSVEAIRSIAGTNPVFIFQAAEFAFDSLDSALSQLRITEPLPVISSLFALHPTRYLLIESVERLLEAPSRDAFFSFLRRVAEDTSWRAILTCRQHAAEMFRDAFLRPLDIDCSEQSVPLLTLQELQTVVANYPQLGPLVSSPRTRRLLLNPWYLDRACSLSWNDRDAQAELNPFELKNRLWRQIVSKESERTDGIHLVRERVFQEISLRRARSLSSFVKLEKGEEQAAQLLIRDELLVQERTTGNFAPAHDVLEDWALERWIDSEYDKASSQHESFFHALGYELPIRRSYRQWLQEKLEGEDLEAVCSFVERTVNSSTIEVFWRDETSISLLLSDEGARFIESNNDLLFKDNKQLLYRFLHLLRIAAKKPNPYWRIPERELAPKFGDLHLVPKGKSWSAVIRAICRNLPLFEINEIPSILGFLEDWKRGLHWSVPLTETAREAGLIAIHFWNKLEDTHKFEKTLERLCCVVCAVSGALGQDFVAFVSDNENNPNESERRKGFKSEVLEDTVLGTFDGWAASRSHPSQVVRFATMKWGLEREPSAPNEWAHIEMNQYFGIWVRSRDFSPASALQGPFFPLLQGSEETGINFILKLCNVAAERYARFGLDREYGAEPVYKSFEVEENVEHSQLISRRIWLMFREGMPGPDVLHSALMALEKWLLDKCKAGENVEAICRKLILESNSCFTTAVVGSVASAYPEKVGKLALIFVLDPDFIELDRHRWVYDKNPVSTVLSGYDYDGVRKAFRGERIESDKLPHRKETFEQLLQRLQTGPMRDLVFERIDQWKGALPPVNEQTEEMRWWRLLLHRNDLRNLRVQERRADGAVLLTSSPPPEDIAQLIEASAPRVQETQQAINLISWAMAVFEGKGEDVVDASKWREMLAEAKRVEDTLEQQTAEQRFSFEGGTAYVAAVCVRDHWNELSREERQWCRDLLLEKINEGRDFTNRLVSIQRYSSGGSRAAARVLPLLLRDSTPEERRRVEEAIAAAATHGIIEIQQYAAASIGRYLWEFDSTLASACVAGLVKLACVERSHFRAWLQARGSSNIDFQIYLQPHISEIRAQIVSRVQLAKGPLYKISINEKFCSYILPLIALMLVDQNESILAKQMFKQIGRSFCLQWKRGSKLGDDQNFQNEHDFQRLFARFTVGCDPNTAKELWQPFLDSIPQYPEGVTDFWKDIVYAQDGAQGIPSFWKLWELTADELLKLPNVENLASSDYHGHSRLFSVLLLDGIYWKKSARVWQPLVGHGDSFERLFKQAGSIPKVFRALVNTLDSVGNFLLPDAISWLEEHLDGSNDAALLGSQNTLFSLARILSPLIYGQTATLHKSPQLRQSALKLLNAMVEQGSSAAFRMREFLITPTNPP